MLTFCINSTRAYIYIVILCWQGQKGGKKEGRGRKGGREEREGREEARNRPGGGVWSERDGVLPARPALQHGCALATDYMD
jgi:hypothetical protein